MTQLPSNLRSEVISIFEGEAVFRRVGGKDVAIIPSDWSPATRLRRANAVLAASSVCMPSFTINSISDLLTIEVLKCLRNKVIVERNWRYSTLASVLSALRLLHRTTSDVPLPHIDAAISYADRQERTFKYDRVLKTAQYIDQAAMLWGFGRILECKGGRKGSVIKQKAALLATAAAAALRRGEIAALHGGDIRISECGQTMIVCVTAATSKGRVDVQKRTADPRIIAIIKSHLTTRAKDAPLFQVRSGDQITAAEVGRIIATTTAVAGGVPASANLLRRAAVADLTDEDEIRRVLGHSPTSNTTSTHYQLENIVRRLHTVRNIL